MSMLTQEYLKELLHYDPETGIFTNLTQRAKRVKKGTVAGYKNPKGYIYIGVDGESYGAHRLAWLYVYGEIPLYEIDHKNELKGDNRLCNLRLDIDGKNPHNNSKPNTNNTSGYLGVTWCKACNNWQARITVKGKRIHLGYYNTAEEASEAYLAAKRDFHPFWIEEKNKVA